MINNSPPDIGTENAISSTIFAFPGLTPNSTEKLYSLQVETAMAFLQLCGRPKRPNYDSQYLKHVAEDWGAKVGCPYISAAALTAAAIALGFSVKMYGDKNPYAGVGVNKRGLERITENLRKEEFLRSRRWRR